MTMYISQQGDILYQGQTIRYLEDHISDVLWLCVHITAGGYTIYEANHQISRGPQRCRSLTMCTYHSRGIYYIWGKPLDIQRTTEMPFFDYVYIPQQGDILYQGQTIRYLEDQIGDVLWLCVHITAGRYTILGANHQISSGPER